MACTDVDYPFGGSAPVNFTGVAPTIWPTCALSLT
jgi:hypothetical protein